MEKIEQGDLEPVLAQHRGNKVFAQVLDKITSSDALLRALGRYIHFNSIFAGGVANLAGEIAARQDLFRDPNEPLEIIADRSTEVASKVFSAAIDEFGDRTTSCRDTHRTLAQATLKGVGQFFGYDSSTLNGVVQINQATFCAMRDVLGGYFIDKPVNDRFLFYALGFHMGSEILADEEFRLLDGFLRKRYSDLVDYLEKTKVEISGVQHAPYHWIRIHTTVEADHFACAVAGANIALQYYVGQESQKCIKAWILKGFTTFTSVQAEFMRRLSDA